MIRKNTKKQPPNRAVGYVCRSTDRQEKSIEDQEKALQDYAAEHGLRLAKFYVDDAISGTSTIGRRAFQQMIGDAESPTRRFDIIVVYDVKRFGRIDTGSVVATPENMDEPKMKDLLELNFKKWLGE